MELNDLSNVYQFCGYKILESPFCTDSVRVRRHKKRRIDKKWLKRYGYHEVPKKEFYLLTKQRVILAHPIIVQKLKESLNHKENKVYDEVSVN